MSFIYSFFRLINSCLSESGTSTEREQQNQWRRWFLHHILVRRGPSGHRRRLHPQENIVGMVSPAELYYRERIPTRGIPPHVFVLLNGAPCSNV
jgi:hypothetical protein